MTHNPHDLLSKDFLNNLEVAKDFLNAYLPEHIKNRCDFSTLRPEPTSHIEPDLRPHFLDVLYSLKIDGETALVYVLIEPQHKPLKLMPLRLLRYVLSPLKQFADRHGDNSKLPVIIPILLYTGSKTPYPYSMNIFDCFADPELAKETLLNPKLIDLSMIPDEELINHGYAAFLEMVFKHIRDRDILNLAHVITKLLKTYPLTRDLFKHMLNYVVDSGESQNYEEFLQIIIDQTAEEYKETTVTIAEQLENRGYQKGIHAGIEQGVLQGIEQGKAEGKVEAEHETKRAVARNMLSRGADINFIKEVTGLSDQDLAKIVKTH